MTRPARAARERRSAAAVRRPVRGVAGLVLLAALASACADSSASPEDPRNGVPSTAPADTLPTSAAPAGAAGPTLPLTGTAAASADATSRPVVAVPVDAGTGLAAPAGLAEADVVYVSFPGTRRQRALALFQGRDSDRVGPVGDTRPLDGKLLRALSAVLEHSGGTSGFVKQVARADLPEWSSLVQPSSFTRDAAGNVFGSTAAARQAVGVQPARPGLLPFSERPAALPAGAPAPAAVRVAVAGQDEAVLTFDAASATWRGTVGTLPVAATNVVVQQTTYAPLELPKTGGRVEGNPDPDGQGTATFLTGPVVQQGSWNRPGGRTNTKYVGADGGALRFTPGVTWVLLVPAGTPVATS